ncbi:hypothetical protein BC830DRAFT_1120005 [Chytriomyces sp. MP71]|nr:hypothetical protein BC830DRAFT_1120005 [Chytriomyces sp. MP71]
MSGLQQRKAFKADLDGDKVTTEPLDDQQQEEIIEGLRSQNEASGAELITTLKVLSGAVTVLLAVFALLQTQHHLLHAAMSLVSSLSVAFSFSAFSRIRLLQLDSPIWTRRVRLALAVSLVPLASLFMDADYHGSEYIKYIYLVPVGFLLLIVYMGSSLRDVARGVESLEKLRYHIKGA